MDVGSRVYLRVGPGEAEEWEAVGGVGRGRGVRNMVGTGCEGRTEPAQLGAW